MIRALRRVDRNLVMIDTKAVTRGISIGKQSRLQHFVGRKADAWNDGRRREGSLLNFREDVVRIAVEFNHANVD